MEGKFGMLRKTRAEIGKSEGAQGADSGNVAPRL